MKNTAFKLWLLSALSIVGFSCQQDDQLSELVRDNRPAVPVTFTEATTFGFNPYVETSLAAGGNIRFTLSIPAGSGRTIREITKVGAGPTAVNAATLNGASYTSAPIPGNGTTAVFTTTINQFKTKFTEEEAKTTPVALPNFTEIAFIFLVTLDDDTQIVTQQARVRILP